MATRLYFSSSQSAAQSLGFAAWAQTNSVTKRALLTETLSGDNLALGLQQLTTVGSFRCDQQFVSPSFTGTSFINSAISVQLACREFNNGDNTVTALAARVVTASGTLRGTLLAATKWFGPTSELINNATLRNMAFASGTIMTSVTALPNDRVVVEIGFGDNAGASPEFQARYGAPAGITDHAANMTETTSHVGWVEFASTLLFTVPATLQLQQLSENVHAADERMSGLNKRLPDGGDLSDANMLGRFMLSGDRQDILDGYAKMQAAGMADSQNAGDAFSKLICKRINEDQQDFVDTLTQLVSRILVITENQRPISDAASGTVHRCVANVFVWAIRNRLATDNLELADEIRKLLVKVVAERQDVTDAAALTAFTGVVLVLLQLSDQVDVRDGFFKLFGMNQQEAQQANEALNKLLSKNLTDVAEAQDALTKRLRKVVDETQHVSDAVVSSIVRFLLATDNQAVSDLFSKMLKKSIAENQDAADAFSKLMIKMAGDNADIVDIALAFRVAIRTMLDNVDISDAFTKLLTKRADEVGGIVDQNYSLLRKSLADRQDVSDTTVLTVFGVGLILLALSDTLALSDDQRKALFKNVGDLGGMFDAESMLLAKSLADRQDAVDLASATRLAIRLLSDSLDLSDRFGKALLKNIADDEAAFDALTKRLSKSVGDTAEARDEFASQFSKAIGDRQDVQEAFAKTLNKMVGDGANLTDDYNRLLRKVLADIEHVTDAAALQKLTQLVLVELVETQDVRDEFVKKLFKVLSENQSPFSDATASQIVELFVRRFIESMVADSESTMVDEWGAKPGMRLFTDIKEAVAHATGVKGGIKSAAGEDDPLDIFTGVKGKRQK